MQDFFVGHHTTVTRLGEISTFVKNGPTCLKMTNFSYHLCQIKVKNAKYVWLNIVFLECFSCFLCKSFLVTLRKTKQYEANVLLTAHLAWQL
jgi:hypothetical protein